MADSDLLWVGITLAVLGLLLFIVGFISLKKKSLIQNTPTSKTRSVAMGLTEVYGQVEPVPGVMLKSIFSNQDCVYYRYVIEEYRHSKNGGYWAIVKQGSKGVEFFLKDDTGKVLVDPNGAEIELTKDFRSSSGWQNDPPANVIKSLKSIGFSHEDFFGFNKRMKYVEWVLGPNEWIYVLGNAGDNPFVDEASAIQNAADIMIQKGGPVFYISDSSEKELLGKFKWKVAGGVGGGGAITLIGLALIFLYFGML